MNSCIEFPGHFFVFFSFSLIPFFPESILFAFEEKKPIKWRRLGLSLRRVSTLLTSTLFLSRTVVSLSNPFFLNCLFRSLATDEVHQVLIKEWFNRIWPNDLTLSFGYFWLNLFLSFWSNCFRLYLFRIGVVKSGKKWSKFSGNSIHCLSFVCKDKTCF